MPYYGISNNTLYISETSQAPATTSFEWHIGNLAYPWINNSNIVTVEILTDIVPNSGFAFFYELKSLKAVNGLNHLKLHNTTTIDYLFYNCVALEEVDLNDLDVSSITSAKYAFWKCSAIKTVGVETWDIGNMTEIAYMFRDCSALINIDVSNWDVSNVTDINYMFAENPCLEKIYCDNTWVGASGVLSETMFIDNPMLGGVIDYDDQKADINYANPNIGYFTKTDKPYIGIDSTAKEINHLYIGVDGNARRVYKGYIGVDGKSRRFFWG